VRPHGSMSRGQPISLNVRYHGPPPPLGANVIIVVYSNDLMKDVVAVVAEKAGKNVEEIKLYFKGKDFKESDSKKTASQIGLFENENIMVQQKLTAPTSSNLPKIRIDAPLEKLPAMILAKDHFDVFFELLESSTGTDCDDIWDLIMQLPTCTTIASRWLTLSCTKVIDILSLSFSHTTNLGRILYSLQILEMLIQPSHNMNEVTPSIQIGETRVATNDIIQNWITNFVIKGGIYAISEVFKKLAYTIDENICKYGFFDMDVTGVTPSLIISTFTLTTKILRSVFIHTAAGDNPDLVQSLLSNVKIVGKMEQEKVKSRQVVNIDKQDVCLIGPIFPDDVATATASNVEQIIAMDEDKNSKPNDMISDEWGWLFAMYISSPQTMKILIREIALDSTQSALLLLLATLRRFSQIEYFYKEGHNSKLNQGSMNIVKLKQEELLQISNNLLVIWSSIVILEPSVINNIKIDQQDSLTGLGRKRMRSPTHTSPSAEGSFPSLFTLDFILLEILGVTSVDLGVVSSYKSDCVIFGDKFGQWAGDAILFFLLFLNQICVIKLSSSQISDDFREKMFWSLISMRPPIETFASLSATSLKPFFRLTSTILEGLESNDFGISIPPINISDDSRITSCLGILEELKSSRKTHTLKDSPRSQLFCGTLRLLTSLSSGHDNVLAALVKENVVDFLLADCLSLNINNTIDNEGSLCSDDSSKSEAYNLLLTLCSWSDDIVGLVLSRLRDLHLSVPSPSSFPYKPEKEQRSEVGYVGLKNMGSTCYMNR